MDPEIEAQAGDQGDFPNSLAALFYIQSFHLFLWIYFSCHPPQHLTENKSDSEELMKYSTAPIKREGLRIVVVCTGEAYGKELRV